MNLRYKYSDLLELPEKVEGFKRDLFLNKF